MKATKMACVECGAKVAKTTGCPSKKGWLCATCGAKVLDSLTTHERRVVVNPVTGKAVTVWVPVNAR